MDVSAIDRSISTLEQQISGIEARAASLESWLSFWTAVVVAGVFLEVIVIFKEFSEDRAAWRRGSIRSPEKPSLKFFLFEVSAALMVAVGVAGELWLGVKAGDANAELTVKSGVLVGLVREKAANAEKGAAESRARAAALEVKSLALQEQIIEMGPRDLLFNGRRGAEFVKIIKPFRGQPVVVIYAQAVMGNPQFLDPEVQATIKQLRVRFTEAGWVLRQGWELPGFNNNRGILVMDDGTPEQAKKAGVLLAALRKIPLAAEPYKCPPVARSSCSGQILVMVAANPARPAAGSAAPLIPLIGAISQTVVQ